MPDYKLISERIDNGQAVKARVTQPDESAVYRLAEKRGIRVISVTELPAPADDLDKLAASAIPAGDLPAEHDTQDDASGESIERAHPTPARQTPAPAVPRYLGVKYSATIFGIMGALILLLAVVGLLGCVVMLFLGAGLRVLPVIGVALWLVLISAVWLAAGFMMEMLRDLTRHLMAKA